MLVLIVMRIDELSYKLWSTSIIRFIASKRISSWKNCIQWSLLCVSIYLTLLSILLYSHKIQVCHNEITQFATIFLSILILCLSLSINLNHLETRSSKQHECGRKIRKVSNRISCVEGNEEVADILNEYEVILDEYENHSVLDYYQFVVENKKKMTPEQKKNNPPVYILYLWFPLARYVPLLIVYLVTVVVPMVVIVKVINF